MRGRRLALSAALVGAVVVGSVATIAVWGGHRTSASTPPPPVSTATIVRTDLTTSTLTEGTLGYAPTDPVVNQMAGTYTSLPAPGTTITRARSSTGWTIFRSFSWRARYRHGGASFSG